MKEHFSDDGVRKTKITLAIRNKFTKTIYKNPSS